MRYVISDVHGCFDEFREMLRKIRFSPDDRLILAGDHIDRGKQSLEMLRWLETCPPNVTPLKGNHDAEFADSVGLMTGTDAGESLGTDPDSNADAVALYESVRYLLKGRDASQFFDRYGTISDLLFHWGAAFRDLCSWAVLLNSYPIFCRFPVGNRDCVVVHAGFCDGNSGLRGNYESPEEFMLYARDDALTIGGVDHGLIIAGHTPTIAPGSIFYTGGRVFRYHNEKRDCVFYDIDCGCAYREHRPAGKLACLRLEDERVFYV